MQGDPGCSHNCNSIGLISSCSQIAWAALSSQIYGISTVQRLNYSCRFDQGLHYSASNPCILTAVGEHCCFTGTLHCSSALCQGLNCLWNQGTVSPKLQANNQLQMTWCINNKHGDTQKPALLLLHSPKLPGWWLTTACAPASAGAIWIYWCFLNILLECDSQLSPKMRNADIHWWHKVTSTLIKYFSQKPCSCIHSHPSLSSWAVTCSPQHSWQEGLWNGPVPFSTEVSVTSQLPARTLPPARQHAPRLPGTQGLIPEGYRSLYPS